MTSRVLPLFTARGTAKTLADDITATTHRAIDVWLRKVGAGRNRVDRVRANEIREALNLKMPPGDDAVEWLRRRARRPATECGWLARAALEELGR